MIKRIDHIAIAVRDIETASEFYTTQLGLKVARVEDVPSQKVRVAFIPIGDTRIELVMPTADDSPISKFLDKKGDGLHHICLETDDIDDDLSRLIQNEVRLIDTTPKPGAHDTRVAFLHPKANSGVLTELAEHPHPTPPAPETPLQADDKDVYRIFFEMSCKPQDQWKIGLEYEIGAVHTDDMRPMTFFGEHDIEGMFSAFREKYSVEGGTWEDGFCFGLKVPYGELSLEPGGQMEFASLPSNNLGELDSQLRQYIRDVTALGNERGLAFYTAGVNPFHKQEEMPWSHKARYKTMRSYLATTGTLGHRMMQQTMSVQFNIDFADERDAVLKYEAARALQPTLLFLSSNSQIYEGQALDAPMRGDIWLNTDPDRCGLPPSIKGFDEYIEYAMDVPMFLIERDGDYVPIANGLTFRQFLVEGFQGHSAQYRDWPMHLSTLFPEVRFKKNALELRMFDGNQADFSIALTALTKGIFYNEANLQEAIAQQWDNTWESAARLIALAKKGLQPSEQYFLMPLEQCVETKQRPGDKALQVLASHDGDTRQLFAHLQLES